MVHTPFFLNRVLYRAGADDSYYIFYYPFCHLHVCIGLQKFFKKGVIFGFSLVLLNEGGDEPMPEFTPIHDRMPIIIHRLYMYQWFQDTPTIIKRAHTDMLSSQVDTGGKRQTSLLMQLNDWQIMQEDRKRAAGIALEKCLRRAILSR